MRGGAKNAPERTAAAGKKKNQGGIDTRPIPKRRGYSVQRADERAHFRLDYFVAVVEDNARDRFHLLWLKTARFFKNPQQIYKSFLSFSNDTSRKFSRKTFCERGNMRAAQYNWHQRIAPDVGRHLNCKWKSRRSSAYAYYIRLPFQKALRIRLNPNFSLRKSFPHCPG